MGDLTAAVPNDAPYGSKEILSISNLTVFDDSPIPQPLPSVADNAIHVAAYFGDTSGDQSYDSPDVTLEQRLIGLKNTGFSAYRLIDPVLLGDITLNGQIQANDTTSIQRVIGLVNVPTVPPLPVGLSPPPSGGPDPEVFIPNEIGDPGDTVSVPVNVTVTEQAGITVSGFQVAIAYDPTKFTVGAIAQLGPMFSSALGFAPYLSFPAPGELIFQASSPTGTDTIPVSTTTPLFTLSFTVAAHAAPGPSVINLLQGISSTATAIFANDASLSQLVLSPAPTNGANDSVDGTFEVGTPAPSVSVSGASAGWGSQSAPLQTASDGLRLLPAGRNLDLPWFNINQIAVTLSQPATVSPGDVTVTGITGGSYGPVTISGSGTSTILITFAKAITSADRVTITIGNSQIIAFTRRLDVLPGDVNDDGAVNTTDGLLILNNETPAHPYNVFYDMNGDGAVTTADFTLYRPRIGTVLPKLPPLQLAAGGEGPGGAAPLTQSELAPVLAAAIADWAAAGLPARDVARLRGVAFEITELPAGYLGDTAIGGSTVYLSADASGWGWFTDPSPWNNRGAGPARGGNRARGRPVHGARWARGSADGGAARARPHAGALRSGSDHVLRRPDGRNTGDRRAPVAVRRGRGQSHSRRGRVTSGGHDEGPDAS